MNSGKWMAGGLALMLLFMMPALAAEADPWKYTASKHEEHRQENIRREPGHEQRPHYRRMHPRPQRLSPEERSQLRRDIKNAGKEIYPTRHR